MLDDDELEALWFEYVWSHGSESAVTVLHDMDSNWGDLDPGEVMDLLEGFADEEGYAAAQRVSFLLMGEDQE